MSILFGLLLARRFYCRSALSLSPGRTGGLLPRINAPIKSSIEQISIEGFKLLIVWKLSEMPIYQEVDGKGCVIKAKKSNFDIISKLPFFYGTSNRARTCDTAVNRHNKKVSEALCIKGFTHCADDIWRRFKSNCCRFFLLKSFIYFQYIAK